MSDDVTRPSSLPMPPVGTRLRDPQGIIWSVVEHESGRARLASVIDPDLRRLATAERLSAFDVVDSRRANIVIDDHRARRARSE